MKYFKTHYFHISISDFHVRRFINQVLSILVFALKTDTMFKVFDV